MKKKITVAIACCFLLVFIFPILLGLWVKKQVSHRMKTPIHGDYRPEFFKAGFQLRNASFELPGKLKLESGTLYVKYHPLSLFGGPFIRLELISRNINARLLGAWAQMQGVEKPVIDIFQADLGIGPKGLEEIYFIEAKSSSFQFQIKKSNV